MTHRFAAFLGSMAAVLAACASAPAEDREPPKELEDYEATGRTENCLSLTQIDRTKVLDDWHILFVMKGQDSTYLSRLPNRCSQLGFNEAFSYSTSLSQLCNTDIITVIDTADGSPRGSCGLGIFEELKKKAPE